MSNAVKIFLCGDVMTGRGIDQILPFPGNPLLHEAVVKDANEYVMLAEAVSGPIPRPAGFDYIWGDAIQELERHRPDVRIINLETSITASDDYWKGKEVLYRMNPKNAGCINAAKIDCCCLANNHVLDWGYSGLRDTLETLDKAGLRHAGAGGDLKEARAPAIMTPAKKCRVIVFSCGCDTAGVPPGWAATVDRAGVNYLKDYSANSVLTIRDMVGEVKGEDDIVVFSIHWGGNWGYYISGEQREFAHGLIDLAGVDIVYGHSSHHVKGIEVYRNKPIVYGCGDFLNDYEGIQGYEFFRGDLGLMYFITMDATARSLVSLEMSPTQVRKFRVNLAGADDVRWLKNTLDREGEKLGTMVDQKGGVLALRQKAVVSSQ